MKRKICFFVIGLTFNRFVRLKYYEKIFPKDTELFLFTTNKYQNKQTKQYVIQDYNFERIKVKQIDYNPLTLSFKLRSFCLKNKISRVTNIGNYEGSLFLFLATLFTGTDYIVNVFGGLFPSYKSYKSLRMVADRTIRPLLLYSIIYLSKRLLLVDYETYKKAGTFFLLPKNKVKFLPAPADTKLFKIKNKIQCRKELSLPLNSKTIIFVGRIFKIKSSDILKRLIETNPDIFFVVIGRILDKNFFGLKAENLLHIDKKNHEELVNYFNAADLTLFLDRGTGGIGLVAEESLACGIPTIIAKRDYGYEKSRATLQIPINFEAANKAVRNFFNLSSAEREQLSREARKYAETYYSGDVLKEKYIKYYLN